MKEVLANRPFLVFSLMAVSIWTLYAQLALMILLQTPVTRFVISRLHPTGSSQTG